MNRLTISTLKLFAVASALAVMTSSARANVYATDIQMYSTTPGLLTNGPVPIPQGGAATISYRLNQTADLGCTVTILDASSAVVATIAGGTNMGLNTVVWGLTNNSGGAAGNGNYSVSITAAATGFATWTQISVDTNAGMGAYYPLGIDVDKNTNSPYYGRVIVGCALTNTGVHSTPQFTEMDGLYKMNADGSYAEEGGYGYAGYTSDDGGDASAATNMPNSFGYNPMKIRIGDDDRIYWVDNTYYGAIIASDMQATTNQIVLTEANYNTSDYYNDIVNNGKVGFQEFDVAFTTTTNASIWLCDNDYPNAGIWMFHMTNGVVDPNDTEGANPVYAGYDLFISSGGVMVDTNLDIFCGASRNNANAFYDAMVFTNWNGGVLPPDNSGYAKTTGLAAGEVGWGYGCDVNVTCSTSAVYPFESVRDVVINSRSNPTIVACPTTAGANEANGSGIRLLNATNGSIITVTNSLGAVIQTLTNLDFGQQYGAAAWDNVGNLYGASTSRNVWRVWSPPGPSTNTTVAVVPMAVQSLPLSIVPTIGPATNYLPVGQSDTLAVVADGTYPITYKWYQDGSQIPGATTSSYAFNAASGTHTYYVHVANGDTPAGIDSATATVIAAPTALSFSSTVASNSSAGWTLNGGANFWASGVLELTDYHGSEARSAFYALSKLSVNGFVATFTLNTGGNTNGSRADGATFCVQNSANGPTALGGGGGSLGVSTITPSVEMEFNLYSGAGGGVGISLNSNGGIGPNGKTGLIILNAPTAAGVYDADPINVTIVYNPAVTNIYVNLLDTVTLNSYTTNYTSAIAAANVTNILGSTTAWVGFTGATGGVSAFQQISNFLFQNNNAVLSPGMLNGGNLPFTWTVGAFSLLQGPSVTGPWTPVSGTVTTNYVTGQAQMTVTPSGPTQFFELVLP